MQFYNARQTAERLPFHELVAALRQAVGEYASGRIISPERMVVPLVEGGIMLSMPATAPDIAIHKLVNVQPANARRGLPTIHGQVAAFDSVTGVPLFTLDGPTVTGRRTAAVSLLGIDTLLAAPPRSVLIIGTGTQADHHVLAVQSLYPQADIWVRSRDERKARAFCARHQDCAEPPRPCSGEQIPSGVEVIITVTTSSTPIYDEAAQADRLIIAVGAFTPQLVEIGSTTIAQSRLLVDDLAGARHEAGDFIQAGVDWAQVQTLAEAIDAGPHSEKPVVLKTVGCAAWDLAACRTAQASLAGEGHKRF
ncbi:1-piperideine-2-carboxylate/1-pyrroline-2-carboxylate reductase [NAD(P)H] [Pseudomonas flavescens]|uniref:1-piperideine-2-carboxylate/1-pyrroline-2-carboxylate reductase [NAD(P)H] n=1 Tax=Phytopseudomonas flavescens TaxID=29435 RepID=A0A1G7ZLG3_9GAMM|nr:bifunctional Delta(1)-pyrroline-2-carboxylate/Delta(1)-piperideine-2-carboxylate reductase [Pseudomonas flavescens]SDH09543.1 1-piperideine-2-carboxylate/1-pyrroline-2-carboxylate reductase [NAD(P)H] [Pseudomonas flavescens]